MRYHAMTLLCLVLLSAASIQAQKAQSLEDYVKLGLESNPVLQQRQNDWEAASERLNQARALYMPSVKFEANYTWADGGRTFDFPVGDLLNPVYATLNDLTGSEAFPNIENVSEPLLPDGFQETKLSVIQPLFNPEIIWNRRVQEQQVNLTELGRDAYERELEFRIREAYFRWMQAQAGVEILQNARTVLEELNRLQYVWLQNDKITADAVSTSEAELARLDADLARAQGDVEAAGAWFNALLNRPGKTEILLDSSWIEVEAEQTAIIGQGSAGTRLELEQARQAIRLGEEVVGLERSRTWLPSAYAAGEAGFQGFGYDLGQQDYWLVRVGLEWDLFQGGGRRARIREAELGLQSMRQQYEWVERSLDAQAIRAASDYKAAGEALRASEKESTAAAEAFRIVDLRYQNQQAMLIEYLDAEDRLRRARLGTSIAYYDYLIKHEEYRWTTARDLSK